MKALAKDSPSRGLSLIEAKEPMIIEDDDVIVKVLYSSVCGTDLHIYEWDDWARSRVKIPRIIGHEMVGEVLKVGRSVKNLEVGDIVAGESHIPCQNCYYCRTGRMHLCSNMKILGIDIDGCFAELCKTKAISLWKPNIDLKTEYLSSLEPLGNAVHVISEINPGIKDVLVYGCGPIGLATIYFLKRLGSSKVIAVDISEYRLEVAKRLGADLIVNAKKEDPEERVKEYTNDGVDLLLEMSGSQDGFSKGLRLLRANSVAIFFGIPSRKIELEVAETIIFKEIHIKGVFGRKMFENWYMLEKLIEKFGFPFEEFITHRFGLEEYEEAFNILKKGDCVKILLKN